MKNFDHKFYDKKTGEVRQVHFQRLADVEADDTELDLTTDKAKFSKPIRMPDLPSVKKDGFR